VTRAAVSAERAWHADIMGMPISVRLRGPGLHTPAVQSCVDGAFTWLRRVDAVFSTYRADSDLSRNRRGELPLSACDPLVPDVLELCAQAAAATEGWFDPQVMTSRGRALDPTGIVKGWAVQRAGELLSGLKEHDHYLNAAGDITMIVRDHAAKPWRLGVADPHVPAALVDVVAWRNGGMATSGTAARGGHVYNPFTGRPALELASVTVVGPELMWADVYATAALARGLAAHPWLETLTDYEYFVVTATGEHWHSSGWDALRGRFMGCSTSSSSKSSPVRSCY